MGYNSVIFDMDGVILDYRGQNFDWIYSLVEERLAERGLDTENFTRADLDTFLGERGLQPCVEICNEYGLDARDLWTELAEATTEARRKKIDNGDFHLFDEVRDVLDKLHKEGLEMALVSNAPEAAIELTLKKYGLRKYFGYHRGISDFDDLSDRKPNPDHLNFAKAELKREPFIFIGDSESDIIAAQNADMDSAFVSKGDDSIDTRPDYEIGDLRKVLEIVRPEQAQQI